ncbi:hypothetical protein B484DRAFT_423498 [Ochromonadaceae sp. CCMP2298]|nr:hypothetical protein B484DRAFT_423498 [Ochromonadaceae sp. CCMP2298]
MATSRANSTFSVVSALSDGTYESGKQGNEEGTGGNQQFAIRGSISGLSADSQGNAGNLGIAQGNQGPGNLGTSRSFSVRSLSLGRGISVGGGDTRTLRPVSVGGGSGDRGSLSRGGSVGGKSVGESVAGGKGGKGGDVVTAAHMQYTVSMSVNRAVAEATKLRAQTVPDSLFGWQVRILEHSNWEGGGIYVISGVKKSIIGPPEFRLTDLVHADQWVKLGRGGKSQGLTFTPVRRVVTADD